VNEKTLKLKSHLEDKIREDIFKSEWAGHVARMGEERGCIRSWWGNRRERDHWGDLGIDG
jgi:hypothetical protein